MARSNNSASVTLTATSYAGTAKSVCYTLPVKLQALVTKNTSVYVKIGTLAGLVDKSGNIPATMTMNDNGFTPLSYCAIDALPVSDKGLENFGNAEAFYSAVREGLCGASAAPVQPKQETIVRPRGDSRTPKNPTPTVAPVQDVKPQGRVTGDPRTPKNHATVTPPATLQPAAQITPPASNSRIDALENGLNTVTSQLATLLQALAPAKKAGK